MAITSREEAIFTIIETEFPSLDSGDVENLAAKVDKGTDFESALHALIGTRDYYESHDEAVLRSAYDRLREIQALSDDAIQRLAEAVEHKATERREAKLNDQRLLEEQEFLNAPSMQADFEHFIRLAYWNTHEAACLLLSKDPRHVKLEFIQNAPNGSPFAEKYRDLTKILTRAAEMELIGTKNRVEPTRLIHWAPSAGINIPKPLTLAVSHLSPEVSAQREEDGIKVVPKDPAESSPSCDAKSVPELQMEIVELKKKLKSEKTANSRWRKTTLILLRGLLYARMGTPRENPASVQEVVDFVLKAIGARFDRNTIQSRLNEADDLLRELQQEIDQLDKKQQAEQ